MIPTSGYVGPIINVHATEDYDTTLILYWVELYGSGDSEHYQGFPRYTLPEVKKLLSKYVYRGFKPISEIDVDSLMESEIIDLSRSGSIGIKTDDSTFTYFRKLTEDEKKILGFYGL